MTELEFYKFIEENNIEYHWHYEDGSWDVIFFVDFDKLQEFNNMLGYSFFDEEGYRIIMKHTYVCFWAEYICEYFDIEKNNIFKK